MCIRDRVVAAWPVELAATLRSDLEAGAAAKVSDWADVQGAARIDFEDADAFFNVNTQADLERAARLLQTR